MGGRFLKRVVTEIPVDDIVENGEWCEADEAVALEKCKQTLRDNFEKGKQVSNDETYEGSLNVNSYIDTDLVAMAMLERRIDEQKLLMTRILLQQYQQGGALHDSVLASSSGSIVRGEPPDSPGFPLNSHSSLLTMNTNNGGDYLKPTFLPAMLKNTEEALSAAPLRGTMPSKVGHPAGPSPPSKGLFPPGGSEARASSSASMQGSTPYSLLAGRPGLDPRMQARVQQCQQIKNGPLADHSVGLGSIPQLRPNPGLDRPTLHDGTRLVGDMKMRSIDQAPIGASQASDPPHNSEENEKDHVAKKTNDDDKEDKKPQFKGITESFPQKLYRMLQEAEEYGHDDVLSFSPDGRAFNIHKPRTFLEDIMPRYFSTTCMSSFDRQLSLYGFRRVTKGRDKGYYCHRFFLKGRKGLVKMIKLQTSTGPKRPTKEVIEEAIRAYQREISDAGVGLGFPSTHSTMEISSHQQNLLAQSPMTTGGRQWALGLENCRSRLPPSVSVMDELSDPSMQFGNAAMRSHLFATGNGFRVDPTTATLLEEHKQSELRIAQLQQRRQQLSDLFHLISY
jgi:hypothetical protein